LAAYAPSAARHHGGDVIKPKTARAVGFNAASRGGGNAAATLSAADRVCYRRLCYRAAAAQL